MAELKTKPSKASVAGFLNAIKDDEIRKDSKTIAGIMSKATRSKPTMWGPDIVGFGSYHYKYASGREGDWMLTAFAPRKKNITLYIMPGFEGQTALMKKLGPHSGGKSCVHIKRLSDLHLPTLKKLGRLVGQEVARAIDRQVARSFSSAISPHATSERATLLDGLYRRHGRARPRARTQGARQAHPP